MGSGWTSRAHCLCRAGCRCCFGYTANRNRLAQVVLCQDIGFKDPCASYENPYQESNNYGYCHDITLLLVCSDQLSKMLIRSALPHMSEVAVIDRFLSFFHSQLRRGMGFSRTKLGIHLLTALSAVVSVLLIVVIKRTA